MHIFKWLTSSLFCALTLLWTARAHAVYVIHTNAGNSTSIFVDHLCNLTEAIASINAGGNINTDCADDGTGPWPPQYIYLDSGSGTPPVYNVAPNTAITQTNRAVYIFPPSEYPAVIQATGNYALQVASGATVTFQDIVFKHVTGSFGRAFYNRGTTNAYFTTFQDGDVSTGTCDTTHFDSNSGCGGGILNRGLLTLGFCTIQNSKAKKGGGIFNGDPNGSPKLTMNPSNLIQNNKATVDGGGLFNELSNGGQGMDLYQSTFKGNWAQGNGGGIMSRDRVLAHNLTISGNKAGCTDLTTCGSFGGSSGFGGGIYRDVTTGRYLEMTFSTVAFNEAVNGGGFYVSGPPSGVGFTAFSIFANNVIHVTTNKAPDVFGDPHSDPTKPTGCMIKDISGDTDTGGDFHQDPLLRALAFDGWVWTHGLPSNSPAINRATRDNASIGDNLDGRGFTRPAEATGTTVTDLGAFEYQPGIDPP